MSWLARLLNLILPTLLDWLYKKVMDWKERRAAREKIREENRKARENHEKAETPEERERSIEDIADRF